MYHLTQVLHTCNSEHGLEPETQSLWYEKRFIQGDVSRSMKGCNETCHTGIVMDIGNPSVISDPKRNEMKYPVH